MEVAGEGRSPEDYLIGDIRATAEGSKCVDYVFDLGAIWRLVKPLQKLDPNIRPKILLIAKKSREAIIFRGNFETIEKTLESFLTIAEKISRERGILDEFLPLEAHVRGKFLTFKNFIASMTVKHSLLASHTQKWFSLLAEEEPTESLGGYDLRYFEYVLNVTLSQKEELKDALFLRDMYLKTDDPSILQRYLQVLRDFDNGSFAAGMLALEDELMLDILWVETTEG